MAGSRVACAVTAAALAVSIVPATAASSASSVPAGGHALRVGSTAWSDDGAPVAEGAEVSLAVALDAGSTKKVTLRAESAAFLGIPDACEPSTIVRRRSFISDDARTLVCQVRTQQSQAGHSQGQSQIVAELRAGAAPGPMRVNVSENGRVVAAVERAIVAGPQVPQRRLRLLSSPDFLNADVADLSRGPGFWRPGRSENSTSPRYEKALARVLDDWKRKRPDAVLVAGDMVNGRWGRDQRRTGNFGPVENAAQRAAAAKLAAATYYPQYLQRFRSRGLDLYAAPGDHEYGDDPWTASKRRLAPVFREQFARYFTRTRAGKPKFRDRPRGPHAETAYAFRPAPNVQLVSIDPFDITLKGARIQLDPAQLRWVEGVLAKARRDGVEWIIVQGHVPILWPVRVRGSSGLRYQGGPNSELWRLFKKYGVDIYLCGEVHDVTATTRDGIVQLAHGGAFQFGLTTYAVVDVYDDAIELTLNDYAAKVRDARERSRLWETVRGGLKKLITIDRTPFTIGTLRLEKTGEVSRRTGALLPYR